MKNKIDLKNALTKILLIIIIFLILIVSLNIYEYKKYQIIYNNKINAVISKVEEKYPEITKDEIIEIINSKDETSKILQIYGLTENDTIIPENELTFKLLLIVNITLIILAITLIVFIFLKYNSKKDKELKNITKYIEQINNKNYKLDIDGMSEDELSILKNEIYKTTIMLKEQAENSQKDKVNLKNSLSDISHQLKTPLTSILIMLDNLIDNPEMDYSTRNEFIKSIKKDIININFLVQSLLKLSKFDSNTITFIKEETTTKEIIEKAVENVSNLSDLKNITINKKYKAKKKITCDYMWQTEAITNIIKNALEHSNNYSKILIETEENNLYSEIKITNYGTAIDKKDIPHIFERFYKGKNSSPDSIGIGLSLSKTIIENDNGRISVSSENDKTTFTIKYFYSLM